MYLEGNQRLHWTSIYNNLLRTSEPGMILQELFRISEKKDGEKLALPVSELFLEMLDDKMQFQYAKIETAFFSKEYFQNSSNHGIFALLRKETELCIQLGDCQPLLGKLESIGDI